MNTEYSIAYVAALTAAHLLWWGTIAMFLYLILIV